MKTNIGFKLFEQDTFGNLYPLFIDKNTVQPMNEWIMAECYPTKGFSLRCGWHLGKDIPAAPWLLNAEGKYVGRRKGWKRVWAEVEYCADIDYTEEVQLLPGKCFKDHTPTNGFYFFRETGAGRIWIIADRIKILRVLTEDERQQILNDLGYNEMEAFEPYRQAMMKRMNKAM